MSNDKRKSLRRRMKLLMKAMERPIRTNCQGGMSGDNADLLRLIEDKHVEHVRDVLRQGDGVHTAPKTNTTYRITEAGKLFYMRHKDLLLTAEQKQEAADAAFERRMMVNVGNDTRKTKLYRRRDRLRQRNDQAARSADAARIRHEAFKNASQELGERHRVETAWMRREDLLKTPEGALFASVAGYAKEASPSVVFPSSTMTSTEHSLTEVYTLHAPLPKAERPTDQTEAQFLSGKMIALCRPDGGAMLMLKRRPEKWTGPDHFGDIVEQTIETYQVVYEASDPITATFLMFQFRGMTPYTMF